MQQHILQLGAFPQNTFIRTRAPVPLAKSFHHVPDPGLLLIATGFSGANTLVTSKSKAIVPE